jgi:hypothetical protein
MKFVQFSLIVSLILLLVACEKPSVELTTVSFVNKDKGSGNFDRMIEICFTKPLTSDYYHQVTIITHQSYKLQGGNVLRPMASDPDNKCQTRNLYNYINRSSPIGARDMIKDYMTPGNINQLLIKVYAQKPEGKELPLDERLYKNL